MKNYGLGELDIAVYINGRMLDRTTLPAMLRRIGYLYRCSRLHIPQRAFGARDGVPQTFPNLEPNPNLTPPAHMTKRKTPQLETTNPEPRTSKYNNPRPQILTPTNQIFNRKITHSKEEAHTRNANAIRMK